MTITTGQLAAIMPYGRDKAPLFVGLLNSAMYGYEINTPLRQAAFLAQVAHESGQLRYTAEIASGAAYEGRLDLGNTCPGDGIKYKGRGLIQITGRTNYVAAAMGLDLDLIIRPELLETPANATTSAAWWWKTHDCNKYADLGDMVKLTHIINGGTNGLEDRLALYTTAKHVLGVS